MSIKDTMENVDWNRVGADAALGAGGLIIGGPVGMGAGVAVAEGARVAHSHLTGQTGDTTEGSEG